MAPVSRRSILQTAACAPLLLVPHGVFAAAPGTRRRALLIGVSGYERGKNNRWPNLSTETDAYTLRHVLQTRFGFGSKGRENDKILCLTTPAQTTRQSIITAIQTLVDAAQPGDIIYFHFSGHGAARFAPNGDAYSTLVPSDWREPGNRRGENHIASADLLRLFGAIKQKMTPHGATQPKGSLFLTFDACHSGKIVRGAAKVRGESPGLAPAPPANAKPDERNTNDPLFPAAPLGSGFAALFACRPDQAAGEISEVSCFGRDANGNAQARTDSMGRFSYFLAKTLAESTQTTTYDDVVALVRGALSAAGFNDQNPEMRGDTDFRLLGGSGPPRTQTIAAEWQTDFNAPSGTSLILRAGALTGITKGSTYALYKIGDNPQSGAVPQASAVVQSVQVSGAVLKVPPTLSQKTPYRAVETQHIYESKPLLVSVADIRAHPFGPVIIEKLQALAQKQIGLLELTDETAHSFLAVTRTGTFSRACKITHDENNHDFTRPGFVIERVQEGSVVMVLPDQGDKQSAEAAAGAVSDALKNAARLFLINGLQNRETRDPASLGGLAEKGVRVAMRLRPCRTAVKEKYNQKYTAFDGLRESAENAGGTYRDGDSFVIEVENVGTQDAFLTILDLSPDGTINLLYPPKNAQDKTKVGDALLPVKKKLFLHINGEKYVVTMRKPYGSETIKLIASDVEMDFSPLLSPASRSGEEKTKAMAQAEATPLGRLFASVESGRRDASAGGPPLQNTQWCTATIVLNVVPLTPPTPPK